MSEELLTGKEGIEASQGYVEMPPPVPELPEPAIDLESAMRWSPPEVVEEIGYNEANADGTRSGEPSPKNQSISPERGAEDLTKWRERQRETNQALRDQQLKQQLDAARSPLGAERDQAKAGEWRRTPEEIALLPIEQQIAELEAQRQHAAQQQGQQQQQPQEQPQPADQDVQAFGRVLEQNPKWLQMIEQRDQQVWNQANQATQQAQQAVQAAETWTQDSARQASFGLFATFPELQGLNMQELNVALNMMRRQNPERFNAVARHYGATQVLENRWRQTQQQQQQRAAQQYQQEWSKWSADEDVKFVQAFPEMADPVKAPQTAARARGYLQNVGVSGPDIDRLWSGQASISLRDHRAQAILFDAMRYREAIAAVPAARKNLPARVQRPGANGQIASREDIDARAISNQLATARGNAAARLGAELIAARRARSR